MAVDTFQKYLDIKKIDDIEVIVSEEPTNTAQAAAEVHGVPVQNIVKSLILTDGKEFVLVLVPGDKRLDIDKLSELLGMDMRMTTPDEAKEIGGYSIGGVPPFGHKNALEKYIIKGFNADEILVAAAGSQKAVFKVSHDRLVELTMATKLDI